MTAMRTAIITGVSRGLGEALTFVLLARGWSVTGIGRASSTRLAGERYHFVEFDLAQLNRVDDALGAPLAELARAGPDAVCLINNAAVAWPVGVVGQLAASEIAASLAVNLAAPAALANLFCRVFADAGGDRRIVNITSGAAHSPLPGGGLYSVAKAGLHMLTQAIAAEQGADGIRAVSLRPGIIATDMQAFMRSQAEETLPTVAMFREFHAQGQLVAPDTAAARIATYVVEAPVEQGRMYTYAELGG